MLSRTSTCRGLLGRRTPASDTIWISDEALVTTYQRFCAHHKTPKRHGSSVPGPMENRRRIGRRRIAYSAEHAPNHGAEVQSLYNLFGGVDRTQWQWEPPTPRFSDQKNLSTTLPTWLADWVTASNPQLDGNKTFMPRKTLSIKPMSTEDKLILFKKSLQFSGSDCMAAVCADFSREFRQSVKLGQVSETTFITALRIVTKQLRINSLDPVSAARCSLHFYKNAWEGLMSSKVMPSTTFNGEVINKLLLLLARLPIGSEIWPLAADIISVSTTAQSRCLIPGIKSCIHACSQSFLQRPLQRASPAVFIAAKARLANIADSLLVAAESVEALSWSNSEDDYSAARSSLLKTSKAIRTGYKAIQDVEYAMDSTNHLIDIIAQSLESVPKSLLPGIVRSYADHACTSIEKETLIDPSAARRYRYHALLLSSKLRSISRDLFMEVWQKLELGRVDGRPKQAATYLGPLREYERSTILLNYCVSHGLISPGSQIFGDVRGCVGSTSKENFASLLFTISKVEGSYLEPVRNLLEMLLRLGMHETMYNVLLTMKKSNMRIPTALFMDLIEEISRSDARLAFKVHRLHQSLCFDNCTSELTIRSSVIIAMINDARVSPRQIWRALEIKGGSENKLKRGYSFERTDSKTLSRIEIDLLHKMATAFARSDVRPLRVALRNVMQCVYYLRNHGVPMSSELVAAISYAGITREVLRNNWIGTERLRWILDLISKVEGEEAAKVVDSNVHRWRKHVSMRQENKPPKQRQHSSMKTC